ncbi:MAG: tRNA uridine-5-carboxymethylaminomethyl(34) synthesis GTPase MnmE [Salinivirgaceae bacterium]|jgi:tRNA modification GTPase|nr:tRNA uridine-5-carboxymethylaminomethyl(34) synthesis GTPase MnmE [Salinivirgaceae bacterium]
MNDTICAISTAAGNGAIALIRLSGSEAIEVADSIFVSKRKDFSLKNRDTHRVYFGTINDQYTVIDEVLLSIFKVPNTFTGEDVVEISCHGSQYIQQQILHLLIKKGARLAEPGEFTQRAYLNGKMDLSQAEAVADLIASTSAAAHKIAINQMRGGFSNELTGLRADLLQFISLLELELDFGEEDVEFADRTALLKLIEKIEQVIIHLIKSFDLGNAIKNGVPVAIVGEPNVGKSTLLNAILNEEKAIVSDIAGTTRDTIEDTFNYNGVTFRFIDTAGLRETTDTIETLGIERTYQKISEAKIVLALFDANDPNEKVAKELNAIIEKAGEDKKVILVRNKLDLSTEIRDLEIIGLAAQINISAKEKTNIDALLIEIGQAMQLESLENNEVVVSNVRHMEALSQALESLIRAKEGMKSGISNDFLAMDIREVIHYLAGITGEEITTDEVLGNIFGQFCIGK